jgi:hypothetical protein
MTLQLRILLGITIWLGGVILDALLFPYGFILIYIGIALTFFEVVKWLLERENRKRAKEVFGFSKPRNFLTMVQNAFDFSWKRISVLWTMCAVFGMVLMLLGGLMKQSDAYKVAIDSLNSDNEISERTGKIIHFTSIVSENVSSHQTSKINIGVIAEKESFWVTAYLEPTEDGYITTKLEIDE